MQNTFGVQIRNDDITNVGLYHTEARQLLETIRQDAVVETSAAGYAQNETAWSPWLRTIAGIRLDGYRFSVDASDPENGGVRHSGIVSPKGGVVISTRHFLALRDSISSLDSEPRTVKPVDWI